MAKKRASIEEISNAIRLAIVLDNNSRAAQLLGYSEANLRQWRIAHPHLVEKAETEYAAGQGNTVDAIIDLLLANALTKALKSPSLMETMNSLREMWKIRCSVRGDPDSRIDVRMSIEEHLAKLEREADAEGGDGDTEA